MESENNPEVIASATQYHQNSVRTVCFSPDQTKLCSSGNDRDVILTDLEDYQTFKVFSGHGNIVWCSDFSSNGILLATASSDKTAIIWKVESEKGNLIKLKGHTSGVRCVRCFENDSMKLVTGGEDKTVRVWNIERKMEISKLDGCEGYVHSIDILPDDQTVVSGDSRRNVRFFDLRSGKIVKVLDGHHSKCIYCVKFHSKTFCLASGSYDKSIKIIDFRTFQLLENYRIHTGTVRSLCFHRSGKFLLSGSSDSTVRIIDLHEKKVLFNLDHHPTTRFSSVHFSPDGKYFASGGADSNSEVLVWSFPLGRFCWEDLDEEERVKYLHNELLLLFESGEDGIDVGNRVMEIRITYQNCSLYSFKFFLM